ncbi:MAG TPA: outer membrane protein assembly factor BamE [Paraburkholderia sp.]|jgi:outer membrane protein assembly factor BamE|nr:outer membrane protein assembly factor BamE [Paraburkholderia sp.]
MIPESKTIGQGGRRGQNLGRTLTGTLLAATVFAVIAGCSTYNSVTQRFAQKITPYRITIVQGNFVSQEMAEQMHVGMSRDEVKKVLGTPLLTDMFHADRWDYVFYFKRGSTAVVQQRDFVVHFDGDRVASWTGGEDLPSNLELLAEIDGDRGGRKARAKAAAQASAAAATAAATAASAPAAASAAEAAAAPVSASEPNPNTQAADAANRATDAVQTPAGLTPSVRANTPPSAGMPPNGGTMPQQFQLRRQPPPAPSGPPPNPVGPTAGSQGTGEPTAAPAQNPALAAPPPVPASGTGD